MATSVASMTERLARAESACLGMAAAFAVLGGVGLALLLGITVAVGDLHRNASGALPRYVSGRWCSCALPVPSRMMSLPKGLGLQSRALAQVRDAGRAVEIRS